MWRDFDGPAAPTTALGGARPTGWGARAARRRRRHVAGGLCYVARNASPRARRRRHEVLLVSRAAAVGIALLQVAALVRCTTNPDPECITERHRLLTSGCDSPLYNPEVPAGQLGATLDRARATLPTSASVSDSAHISAASTGAPKAILAARTVVTASTRQSSPAFGRGVSGLSEPGVGTDNRRAASATQVHALQREIAAPVTAKREATGQ